MKKIVTQNEEETMNAGKDFSVLLGSGSVVALYGDLGTGKTRFTKGISLGLNIKESVTSPTFTIVNEHLGGRIPLYHFDCYRLQSSAELKEIGFEEYIYGNGVCVLEWADRIADSLPEKRFDVHCHHGASENERIITIEER